MDIMPGEVIEMEALGVVIGAIAVAIALLSYAEQWKSRKLAQSQLGELRDIVGAALVPPGKVFEERTKLIQSHVMRLLTSTLNAKEKGFKCWPAREIWDYAKQLIPGLSWQEMCNHLRIMAEGKLISETAVGRPIAENKYYVRKKSGQQWQLSHEDV
jgi:hypothetical protein